MKNNATGPIASANGGPGSAATATLTVVAPPTIRKSFLGATIPVGGTTTLTFTVTNPSTTTTLTGVAFTDDLPAGLIIASPSRLILSCNPGASATSSGSPGSSTTALTNGTLPPGTGCSYSINVTATTPGREEQHDRPRDLERERSGRHRNRHAHRRPAATAAVPSLLLAKGVASTQAGPFGPSLSAAAGSTVWYRLVLTNNGTTPFAAVTLADTAAGGALPASCPAVPAPFSGGASYTCTYSAIVAAGTTVNTATATASGLVTAATATVTGTTTVPPTPTPSPTPTLSDAIAAGVNRGSAGFGTSSVVLDRPGYVTYLVRLERAFAGRHVAIYTRTRTGPWTLTTGRVVAADGTVHYYRRISDWTGFWAKLDDGASHGRIGTVRH